MKPRTSLLDPSFRYDDAASTDIRKRFKRVRKAIEAQRKREQAQQSADTDKVLRNFEERRKAGK